MWSGQWPGPEPVGSDRAWASNMIIVLRAGPGHTFSGPGRARASKLSLRAGPGPAQLLRARAGPGPQITFAGRAWAQISGPCRALVQSLQCNNRLDVVSVFVFFWGRTMRTMAQHSYVRWRKV